MPEPKDVERCEYMHVHEAIVNQVNQNMPDEEVLYDLAELFKIFGDSTRIKILYVLFESEMCVCDIAQLLGMTQSAISHQLRSLKQSRLVKARREGKTVFYSLARRIRAHHIGPGDGAHGGLAASAYSIKKWRLYHEKAL